MSIHIAPRQAKAVTGPGAAVMTTNPPLAAGLFLNSPQAMMKGYWQTQHRNPWVKTAEDVVSGKFAGVEWALEDENDEDIGDQSNPIAKAILDLMEAPQAALDIGRRMTRRELWNLTSRYMGLCGTAFWMQDARNVYGVPASFLWIRPDRMTPAEDARGNLTGWVLDAQQGAYVNGTKLRGIPIDLEDVLQFNLVPPDDGHFGIGKVESSVRKIMLSDLSDQYASSTLSSGGRLGGLITGTPNSAIPDEVYAQLVRDLRAVTESPDAARRVTVLQGEVNWKPTGMTPLEVGLLDLMKLSRDDILAIWGVPGSQVGIAGPTGLNSGDTKKYDEATLWQGAVHERIVSFQEVIQFQFLDPISERTGTIVEFEIDEPEFDDDSPRYDLLLKSLNSPLRNSERRGLINLEPFGPDVVGPSGLPLDDEVWLPATQVLAYQAPEAPDEGPGVSAEVLGRTAGGTVGGAQTGDAATAAAGDTSQGKARPSRFRALHTSLLAMRHHAEKQRTPAIKVSVGAFLSDVRHDVAERIRKHAAHVEATPGETSAWWTPAKWDKALAAALRPHLMAVATEVNTAVLDVLAPTPQAKAAPAGAVDHVIKRGAARVTKINETTRDKIKAAIVRGLDDGLSALEVADIIEGTSSTSVLGGLDVGALFDDYRAEMIARTELMDAYNASSLASYTDVGVEMVEADDGDGDEECIDRVANNPYTMEDADAIEDHPNGTLAWIPVEQDFSEFKAAPIEPAKALTVLAPQPATVVQLSQTSPTTDAALEAIRQAWVDGMAESRAAYDRTSTQLVDGLRAIVEKLGDAVTPVIHVAPANVTFPDIPAPIVNVAPPVVNVPEPTVIMAPAPPRARTVSKNRDGSYTVTES